MDFYMWCKSEVLLRWRLLWLLMVVNLDLVYDLRLLGHLDEVVLNPLVLVVDDVVVLLVRSLQVVLVLLGRFVKEVVVIVPPCYLANGVGGVWWVVSWVC